jgi:hypothetical protein
MIIVLPQIIGKSFSAVTIYPFIFIKHSHYKNDYTLINHEYIHFIQQKELLWFVFFVWYSIEYFVRIIQYRNRYLAYKNISFEREAYLHENDLEYLKTRKYFSFYKYL